MKPLQMLSHSDWQQGSDRVIGSAEHRSASRRVAALMRRHVTLKPQVVEHLNGIEYQLAVVKLGPKRGGVLDRVRRRTVTRGPQQSPEDRRASRQSEEA